MFDGGSLAALNLGGATVAARRWWLLAAVAVVVVVIDQVTKTLVVDHVHTPVHVIGPFSFELSYNSGIAFSIGIGFGLPIVLVALVLGLLTVARRRRAFSRAAAIGGGLVLGGGLSNLGDRLFRGHGGAVVDFIHTTFWPSFNAADSAVVCGCIVLFFVSWRGVDAPADHFDDRPERADHAG